MIRHVPPLRAGRGVVHVREVLRLLARRLRRGREAGLFPGPLQRRNPTVSPLARRGVPRAGFDAVGVVVVGFGAGGLLLQVDDGRGPTAVDVGVEVLLFVLVEVGARVRGFVFEHLHEAVEARGEEGAEDGADPVDLKGPGGLGVGVVRCGDE